MALIRLYRHGCGMAAVEGITLLVVPGSASSWTLVQRTVSLDTVKILYVFIYVFIYGNVVSF